METKLSPTRSSPEEKPEEQSESKTQRRTSVVNLRGVDFVWEKGPFNMKYTDMELEFD